MQHDYDILIVGGGMVGASLASALSALPVRIGIIERFPYQSVQQPSFDDRSIALAYGTAKIFRALGIWESLAKHVSPIQKIHISDRGRFGATRLDSEEQQVEALGYVVESRALGQALHEYLQQCKQVEVISPAEVESLDVDEQAAVVTIRQQDEKRHLSAALVVAADGTQSGIRQQLQIPVRKWSYGQTAVISNIGLSEDHQQVAYERFTDTGPLAMLPMLPAHTEEGMMPRCSLVWTVRDEQVDEYMQLDDAAFLQRLQQRFGQRLGRFERVGKRHAYPLQLLRAEQHVHERVALIGNAAHTLHPVAGQGYNLGLRDAAVLADVIASAIQQGEDPGSMASLQAYADWREQDHQQVIRFTDGLVRLFTNPLPPVRLLRGLGLTVLDFIPPFKRMLARRSMGLAGRLPRLARGISLK